MQNIFRRFPFKRGNFFLSQKKPLRNLLVIFVELWIQMCCEYYRKKNTSNELVLISYFPCSKIFEMRLRTWDTPKSSKIRDFT